MATPAEHRQQVQFAEFALDLRTGELWRDGNRLILPYQSLQILAALLERPGKLVAREELVKRLWASDVFVDFEGSLNKAMKRLREILHDSADQPRFIETLPRRGYRFIAAVTVSQSPPLEPQGLIGKKVSHYRVLEVIGGGGMGLVYKAEDLKLGRRVALKFLPDELASDPVALQRFEREAQTASSLNHPNICTIHEVEEHDGQPFIVMELLEGETLRDRLASSVDKSIPFHQLLDVAVQICEGLQAAHQKGIIHRDIKPANIFLTTSGQVKILDFGLAKLVAASEKDLAATAQIQASTNHEEDGRADLQVRSTVQPEADSHLTCTGSAMGTAGYMSPEQVRGEKLDARTDLFSFGLVLYEMTTGQRAFSGETAAMVHHAIVSTPPIPVRELNSTLPSKLVATIDKALEKDREQRYQSASEVRADLGRLSGSREPALLRRQWTWLMVAALSVILAAGGGLYWRGQNRIGLTNEDTIVLADFANRTADSVLDDALNTALRLELQQTPFLHMLTSDKTRGALRALKRAEDVKLTPDLARDVCLRTGSRVYIAGSVTDVGNHYRLELQAVNCQTSDLMARTEVKVESRNQLISVLGLASHEFRNQLGEPHWSLQKFNTPLEKITSASPEALQAYTQSLGVQGSKGNAEALERMKQAIQLDPDFVLAYVDMAGYYYNLNDASMAAQTAKKAYELRDRVDQHSRFWVEALYYDVGTGELDKANDTYLKWIQVFPGDPWPHRNYSASLADMGDYERAAEEAREVVRLAPDPMTYYLLLVPYINMNRLQEAKAVFDTIQQQKMDTWLLRSWRYVVAFLENDKAGMQEQLTWAKGKPEAADWLLQQQGDTAIYEGRFRAAQKFYRAREIGPWNSVAADRAHESLRAAETGDTHRALETAAEALAADPKRNDRVLLALAFARAGDERQAQSLMEEFNHEFPLATLVQHYEIPTIRAATLLSHNDPEGAIKTLQVTTPYDLASPLSFTGLYLYPMYIRGLAHLQAGNGKKAVIEFRKMLDYSGILQDSVLGPLGRLHLARAQAMTGDKAAARKSYEDFLALWKDADPDIPVFIQAKAEYAKLQ